MRIAVFTELYAPSTGGQEKFFAELSHALLRRGHKLEVYCIGHERGLAKQEFIDGVIVNRVLEAPHYLRPPIAAMRRDWATMARFAWSVRKIAQKREHDFYLLNQWPLMHALTMPRYASRRSVLHWCEAREPAFFRIVQKLLPLLFRWNAAISDSVSAKISAASGCSVMILPSGIDFSRGRVRRRCERLHILTIGRVTAHKNIVLLVEAFERLKAVGYKGRLKIAGDGPEMKALVSRVAASPVSDQIDVLGFISEDTKYDLLAKCEVLAIPSKREGFPHIVSEAMSCGLPIVTADYPQNGTQSIVEMFESGVVAGQSASAFAHGITMVLFNWDAYSANGRAAARTLDWTQIADRLEMELASEWEPKPPISTRKQDSQGDPSAETTSAFGQ